jgi:ribose transport system permease protein
VRRRIVLAHSLSGLLAGAAAVLAVANLAEIDTSLGQQWLLPSFIAPVLGGSLLTGGRVTVVGTALGAVLLAVVESGLVVLGFNQYWYQIGLGLILLVAVLIGRARIRYLMQSKG